jgi:hypothetical protein
MLEAVFPLWSAPRLYHSTNRVHFSQSVQCSGVEWSGVEWSGVGWSGVEWSGVELRVRHNVTCRLVRATERMGSDSDDISPLNHI